MPVVAVAAAVYAGATIATVGIAAMSTMAVISAVGAIAAGVGAVTGNETLMKIGSVASLVGGVGAFAQNQGWLAGGELAGGADAAGVAADAAADGAEAASNTSQMISEAAPGVADPTAGLAGDTATGITDVGAPAGDMAAGAGAAEAAGTGLINAPLNPLVASDVGSLGGVASVTAGAPATSAGIFDTLKGVGDFMSKNKDLASLGMNFIGGMFDDKKKAETGQINAAAGLYDAKTQSELLQQDILRKQTENANSVPDLTGLKLNPAVKVFNTGAPPNYMAPRPGLINSTGR